MPFASRYHADSNSAYLIAPDMTLPDTTDSARIHEPSGASTTTSPVTELEAHLTRDHPIKPSDDGDAWDEFAEGRHENLPDLFTASNRAVENLQAATLAVERLMGQAGTGVFPPF